jgi:hypothetical protein
MRPYGAVVALALTLGALTARADPTPSELAAARELFARAEKDEDAGRWADALDKVRRASSVKMTAGLRFHIALCEEKLGQLVAALADYAAADQAAREDNNKDVIDAVAEPLRALRARVPTLTLDVPAADGAEVSLDGKPMPAGLFGVAMPVLPGSHRVEARAHGKRPFSTEITLAEREAKTASIRWIDLPTLPSEEVTPTPGETPPPPSEAKPSGGGKGGAIVATVSAAALVGFGVGAFFAADGADANLRAQCPTLTDCGGLRTEVRAWDAAALASWIAGAGLATVAIVLWVKPSHASTTTTTGRLVVRPGGLAFAGTF